MRTTPWREVRDAKLTPVQRARSAERVERALAEEFGELHSMAYLTELLGRDVRSARQRAGLSEAQLASRIGKSAAFVREAESGNAVIDHRYVAAVLRACRLPRDWKGA